MDVTLSRCVWLFVLPIVGGPYAAVEVTEPRITDLSDDKCRGVPCQQSCDAAVGSCICHDGYRLVETRCEGPTFSQSDISISSYAALPLAGRITRALRLSVRLFRACP